MDFLKIGKIFAQDYYAVPDYQRDYEWTNVQTQTLIEDVFSIVTDNVKGNHFFGAIVTIPYEDSNGINKSINLSEYGIETDCVKHVVDGQQRLTSFSVLIIALHDLITDDENVSSTFKKNYAERQLESIVFGNHFSNTSFPAPKLILNGNTGYCYNKELLKISDASYSKIYKGAKRILGAYDFFKKELLSKKDELINDNTCIDSEDFYRKVIDVITNRIVFVEIECDASADAFQVFDSLNGKGLDLTASDRIKNILISWSPAGKGAQKWESLVGSVGEDYLASYFVSLFFYNTTKRISKNKLPDEFKKKYKDSALTNFDYVFSSLKDDALIYGSLREAKTGVAKIDSILLDFKALGVDQVYVLLFAAVKHYGNDILSTGGYYNFIKALFSLIIRMQVCEKSMNKLDVLFSNCIAKMKDNAAPIDLITKMINDEAQKTVDDSLFKPSFIRFAPSDNKTAEVYLRHIENYCRKLSGNRSPVDRHLTVEHIIPQTLSDISDWYGDDVVPDDIMINFKEVVIENIGNKALLYSDDNTSASNNCYSDKLNVYKNGKKNQTQGTPADTFELISEVISDFPTEFKHAEVKSRATKLADIALEIWKCK